MNQPSASSSQESAGSESREEFEAITLEKSPGVFREFGGFLIHYAAWWMAPIVIVLLLAAVLIYGVGSGVPPWIYSLF